MEGSHFQLVPATSLRCFIYNLCFHCLICVSGLDSKLFPLQWAGGKFVTRRHWRDVEEGGSSFPDSDISVQLSLFAIATLWHDTDIKNGAKPPITLWWQADKWKTIMKLGYYLAITKNEVLIGCNMDDPWKYCAKWKKPVIKAHSHMVLCVWTIQNRPTCRHRHRWGFDGDWVCWCVMGKMKWSVSCSVVFNFLWSLWTVARQAALSMGFPRQEYWNGLLFPTTGGLPYPGVKSWSATLQADSLSYHLSHQGSPKQLLNVYGVSSWGD